MFVSYAFEGAGLQSCDCEFNSRSRLCVVFLELGTLSHVGSVHSAIEVKCNAIGAILYWVTVVVCRREADMHGQLLIFHKSNIA